MEYRIDLFAVFILLGLVQAVFLSLFYLGREARKLPVNRYQAVFLLSVAGVVFEILLMYTGYIIDVIHLVDFSEPLALLLGPMIFFIVHAFVRGKGPGISWPHYVLPVAYLLYNVLLFIQPEEVKYNGYLDAYHPDWPRMKEEMIFSDDPLNIRSEHSLYVFISLLIYTSLSFRTFLIYLRNKKTSFWKVKELHELRGRNYLFISLLMVLMVLVFKSLFERDLGDHLIATSITLIIYYSSYDLFRSSRLLTATSSVRRYEKSSLSEERKQALIVKIEQAMQEGETHLRIGYSLAELAKYIGVSSHHLSEVINEGFGKSFFDLLAEHRIERACEMLRGEEGKHLKMEEIAERVGYSSKSSFNTHFKRITGKTPSQYRQEF